MIRKKSISLSQLTLILVITIVGLLQYNAKQWQKQPGVIYSDAISYYAYLPAQFIFNDIKLEKHYTYDNGLFWPEHTPDGKAVIKTTMGLAYLYAPFFAMAHIYAKLFGAPPTGYSYPYQIALLISALFYLAIGLYFLRKVLLRYFSELTSSLTIATIVFGTNLLWYVSFEAIMSHGYIFALGCSLLWVTIRWHESPSLKNTLLIGLIAGLLTLIRPTNILVILYFGLYGVWSIRDFKNKLMVLFGKPTIFLILSLAFLLPWIPQFIYWKAITGQVLFYSYTANESFLFNSPKFFEVLLGYRKGWLIYTPVMLLSIIGILTFLKNKEQFFWASLSLFILFLYMVSCWWCWWFGGSFGLRPMIDIYAFLTIPLAASLSFLTEKSRWIKLIGIILPLVFIYHNCFQIKQFKTGAIHYAFNTSRSYWSSFGHLNPQPGYYDLLQEPDPEPAKLDIQSLLLHIQPNAFEFDSARIAFRYIDKAEPGDATKSIARYTNKQAYSLNHSVQSEFGKPYCFDIQIPVENIRTHLIVKVKKIGKTGRLVVQAEKPSEYCVSSGEARPIEGSEWQQQEYVLEIPKLKHSKYLQIFCCNPVNYLQFYDDFEVLILN